MYISIIITTYNAESYILETLDSLLNQTYKLYEVIVIDDGSTDNTISVVKNFILNNTLHNFRIISLSHVGRIAALNYGIKAAYHNWIAIVDADDLWHVQKLAIQVDYIQKYHLDCLGTDCLVFENNNVVDLKQTIKKEDLNDALLCEIPLRQMLRYNPITHSSIIIKKNLATYNANVRQEDWELWLRLLHSGTKIHLLKLNLTLHRIHNKQSFEAKNHLKYVLLSCALQLKYCFLTGKIFHTPFVLIRLFYHIIFSRKLRLKLIKYRR